MQLKIPTLDQTQINEIENLKLTNFFWASNIFWLFSSIIRSSSTRFLSSRVCVIVKQVNNMPTT